MSILNPKNQNKTDEHKKDIHRFSFSRFRTFHTCPRKHYYQYIEQIQTEENEYTIPGKLFHKCIEQFLREEDMTETFKEFRTLCTTGKLELEPDLLEYMVSKYLQYYALEYSRESTLLVEQEYKDPLDGDDFLLVVIDQAFEKDGVHYIRDIKTTQKRLKYTLDDVTHNQQMLLYLPYVEENLSIKIDAIQIDEVRFAKLEPVPRNANGKPSADKRRLELVDYNEYYEALCEMELEHAPEYRSALEYLSSRGHPLFNRVTAQVLDPYVVSANSQDMLNTYKAIKLIQEGGDQMDSAYRIKGPLCNYCAFKELCDHDMHAIDTAGREMIKEKICKKSD